MAATPSGTESKRLVHELASPADNSSIFLCILLSVLIIEVVFVLVVVVVRTENEFAVLLYKYTNYASLLKDKKRMLKKNSRVRRRISRIHADAVTF
jgi:hypothetical protein